MTWTILRSSTKIKNVQWLIELHRSLMKTLKRKGPRIEPCGTPEVTWKSRERVPQKRTRDCLLVK
jgi:hypothetical protein